MAARSLVNLDAMIPRADFALEGSDQASVDLIEKIGLSHLKQDSEILPILRKPDFQRETNHWSPDQVCSLLECFVNGDLIPSIILWRSPIHLFVIDGGHRLSVLRAWVEDDYGDGPVSQAYFGYEISKDQRRIAKRTRNLVDSHIGKFAQINAKRQLPDLPELERRKLTTIASRGLPIQWVAGNASKAEASFFRINTEGTPIDSIESLLLRNRRRPIAIAARAIIRAGKGHKYWSGFAQDVAVQIESAASELHRVLFEPEVTRPVKTLDLPLGGSKGVRTALEVLIDFMIIANRDQLGKPERLEDTEEDDTGLATIAVLKRAQRLASRVTGNDKGSLGLHPAIYFYGPSGVHSSAMFMGTISLIARKIVNNDGQYFRRFTAVREQLEDILRSRKDLFAIILQRLISKRRALAYERLLSQIIEATEGDIEITDEWLLRASGLAGKIVTGSGTVSPIEFSDDTKSQVFISQALTGALRCHVCRGFLDPDKSISYDHNERVREGGRGDGENLKFAHPFCNQSMRS